MDLVDGVVVIIDRIDDEDMLIDDEDAGEVAVDSDDKIASAPMSVILGLQSSHTLLTDVLVRKKLAICIAQSSSRSHIVKDIICNVVFGRNPSNSN